jgi:hypothetical protein
MNISLEEQIEYMRDDVAYISAEAAYFLSHAGCGRQEWVPKRDITKAILATLEAVRDEQKAKIT